MEYLYFMIFLDLINIMITIDAILILQVVPEGEWAQFEEEFGEKEIVEKSKKE